MKKFFQDFKKFICRGNIIDMAVGVIIGGAFSAIVTALANKIIMPLINWALSGGGNGLESAYTFLKWVPMADDPKTVDLANSIYIDWGAFITAIIDFLLIALVLFIILKVAMKSSELLRRGADAMKPKLTSEDRKAMKAQGLNPHDKVSVEAYLADKEAAAAQAKAEEEAKAKAEKEEAYRNSTEGLLKEILATLKEEKATKKTTAKK